VGQRTVFRWLAIGSFPERKPRTGDRSSLDLYTASLLGKWEAGCHNATFLWREIQVAGFSGSSAVVAQFLAPLR
jgi:hypothetical protein